MTKYDLDYASQIDDYDINAANQHDQQQQFQPQQPLQQHSAPAPWRFVLLNYSNRMSPKKPLKSADNASKYPQIQRRFYNKKLFSPTNDDANNNGHIQPNSEDYEFLMDLHNPQHTKLNQWTNGLI